MKPRAVFPSLALNLVHFCMKSGYPPQRGPVSGLVFQHPARTCPCLLRYEFAARILGADVKYRDSRCQVLFELTDHHRESRVWGDGNH